MRTIRLCLLIFGLSCLLGCSQVNVSNPLSGDRPTFASKSNLAETATPKVIRKLNKQLEIYSPQVRIVSPRQNQTFDQTAIEVQLAVDDLPMFQDEKLKLGNHLNLILDNEPVQPIYDITQPIVLQELIPGTHTIRVFADRPWGESYKNEGAYAQTTFNILTETNDNRPDPNLPLLTYSNPTGTYSAEPILLDFYLTNAPLHSVAQNNPNLTDWQIKATVNGASFTLENWQPVYLKGFNQGENWIQLKLIDEAGNDIENVYNNTVRVINYNPQTDDPLGKLMSDRLSAEDAQPIVEPTYYIQPVGESEIIEPSVEVEAGTEEPTVTETESEANVSLTDNESLSAAENEPKTSTPELKNHTELPLEIAPEPETSSSEITTQPQVTPVEEPDVAEAETAIESSEQLEDSNASTPPTEDEDAATQIIAIAEENSDSDSTTPIATIEISQPESVAIAKDEIDITIPHPEPTTMPELTTEEAPNWWKKILVGLRQKLESLVKLLPNEV